jgi:hypothetical protein
MNNTTVKGSFFCFHNVMLNVVKDNYQYIQGSISDTGNYSVTIYTPATEKKD